VSFAGQLCSGPEDPGDHAADDQELIYALLEEARLRWEQLVCGRADPDGVSLCELHRELGLAGWLASSEIDPGRRLALLAGARQRSTTAIMLHPADSPHALVVVAIIADDVLTEIDQSERLHLAQLHLCQR
jgi:hypothetical protein